MSKEGFCIAFPQFFAACQAPVLVFPGGISTPQNQLKKQGHSFLAPPVGAIHVGIEGKSGGKGKPAVFGVGKCYWRCPAPLPCSGEHHPG